MSRLRAAVLASGNGSNLQALLHHLDRLGERRALDVVLVASDREQAGALQRARAAGIATAVIDPASDAEADPRALTHMLHDARIELVLLAGYLRLIPAAVTTRFAGRILNVHPGPLPAFGGAGMYGLRVHRAVLASHVRHTGPTVHLVDEIYDHGTPLAFWPVPVGEIDDAGVLAARVLRAEHLLFPRVVQRHAERLRAGDAAPWKFPKLAPLDPELDDAVLGGLLDAALAR